MGTTLHAILQRQAGKDGWMTIRTWDCGKDYKTAAALSEANPNDRLSPDPIYEQARLDIDLARALHHIDCIGGHSPTLLTQGEASRVLRDLSAGRPWLSELLTTLRTWSSSTPLRVIFWSC